MLKVPCPRCEKITPWSNNPYRPFCSEQCKLIDLGAWANEEYCVPTKNPEDFTNVSDENSLAINSEE